MTGRLRSRSRQLVEIPPDFEFVAVSDDLQQVATTSRGLRTRQVLQVNGAEIAGADRISSVAFSPLGMLTFWERSGSKWRLRIGDESGPWFDRLQSPQMTDNGLHYVYAAFESVGRRGGDVGRWCLIVDGEKRWPEFDVESFVLHEDGRVAMIVRRDPVGQAIVLDGSVIAESSDAEVRYSNLTFSGDGARLAYVENVGFRTARAVCGDHASEPAIYPILAFGFSPTDELYYQFTNAARETETDHWLMLGSRRLRTNGSVTHVFFHDDGSLLAHIEFASASNSRLVYAGAHPIPIPRVSAAAHHRGSGKLAFLATLPVSGTPKATDPQVVWFTGEITDRYVAILRDHFRFSADGSTLQFVTLHDQALTLHEIDT